MTTYYDKNRERRDDALTLLRAFFRLAIEGSGQKWFDCYDEEMDKLATLLVPIDLVGEK